MNAVALAGRILRLPQPQQDQVTAAVDQLVSRNEIYVQQREVLRRMAGGLPLDAALEVITGSREVPAEWHAQCGAPRSAARHATRCGEVCAGGLSAS